MERWEKDAFISFAEAKGKLRDCREVWMDYCDEDRLWYIDICDGHLTWTSYNLILQCCREEQSIIICADPANLKSNTTWSGWTKILLDHLCPRADWENRCANFITHLQVDMEIADRENQWFKFMLHYEGGSYKPLDHTVFTRQKFIQRSIEGD